MCHMWPTIALNVDKHKIVNLKLWRAFVIYLFVYLLFCSVNFIDDIGISQGLKADHAGQI